MDLNSSLLHGLAVGVFLLLFALEKWFPLRREGHALWQRVGVNLALSVLVYLTAFLTVRPLTRMGLAWSSQNEFGILHWLRLPWGSSILGFLLLDLSFYYWHRLNHQVAWLWRFHNVHHFDPELDVTTGFRFHCVEVALSASFRWVQVVLIGVSLPVFLLYETAFQIATFFHHSNVRLPLRFEKCLNSLWVTPRMHGTHHSKKQEETQSNYSVVFSFWDRFHRTYLWRPFEDLQIGVPGYSREQDNRLAGALSAPFRKQRSYWD